MIMLYAMLGKIGTVAHAAEIWNNVELTQDLVLVVQCTCLCTKLPCWASNLYYVAALN